MQINGRRHFIRCQQNRPRDCVRRTADEIKLAVKIVRARVGDYVVNVSRGVAELGSEAVRYSLNFSHIDVGDRKKAQAIAVRLGVHHAVHLVVDAIQQAIGIDGARNAEFRIGMAADARLK